MQPIEMNRQKGLSLIEVLTSMILLAIGLLGHMALQMNRLSSNHSSQFRIQAALLANDIADRMRLNTSAANAGRYDNVDTTGSPYQEPFCNSTGCDASELAGLDLYQWQQGLTAAMPGAVGTIVRDNTITDQVVLTITISWSTEGRAGLPASGAINRMSMDVGL
ncbi:MAG: type IV pilus modification protein PilV [Exilibacterium sp.]